MRRTIRPAVALPLVMCVGVALSITLFVIERRSEEKKVHAGFEVAASDRALSLRRTVEHVERDLESLGAFFRAAGEIDRAQFRTFARQLQSDRPTQALEWIPLVPDAARDRYEEAARRDGLASFQITEMTSDGAMVPAPRRPEYFPVFYVEPYAGNESALGFDLASNPTRREALEWSRKAGRMAATARVKLVQEKARQLSVLVFLPVYRQAPSDSTVNLHARLRGFVLGVYRLGRMVEEALGYLAPGGIDVYVFDDSAAEPERLLYFHPSRTRNAPVSAASEDELMRGLHHVEAVTIADRTWRVICVPAPGLAAGAATWRPWAILAGCLTVTLLLSAYLYLVHAQVVRTRNHAAQLRRAKNQLQDEIAERCRAEETRESVATQLEIIHRYGNDIVLVVAPDGTLVQVNDRAIRSYGYPEEEMLRLNIRDLRAPEARVDRERHLQQELNENAFRLMTMHRRRDGSTFPVEVSTRQIEIGGKTFLQSVIRDLTEERAARATIEYQAMLLDNLYEAVIGTGADLVVTAWNHAAVRVFGWSQSEAIGRPLEDLLPSEYPDGSSLRQVMARAARAGRIKCSVRRQTRAGNQLDIESTSVALQNPDGSVLGYVSVDHDVSDRNRVEAELRTSQERLALILETSSEGIWIVDVEGRIEFVNAHAAKHFGTAPEEIAGRLLLEVIPEEGRAAASADLAAVLRGEGVKREFPLHRPGAPDAWIDVSWSALRGLDGEVVGGVCLFVDVTEHRYAREQLLQAQKMDAVGQLASGIAHDFNNLLVSIVSCSEFLLDSLPQGDPRRDDAQDIKAAGDRAAQLVRQLLTFGRKSAVRPVDMDLNTVVRGVERILRRTIGEQVTMSVSLEPVPWSARIDLGQFEQVLVNLVVNARDAMPEGGELRITTSNVTNERQPPHGEALAPGQYAVLSVADTGCGMTPDVLARIFEPFFTTKEKGRGTGLGLSTVYGIVKAAGGTITVDSTPGQGTTFRVYLPVCDAKLRYDAGAGETSRARGRNEMILLVEDEDAVRKTVRRMLEESGFSVTEALGPVDALRRIREDDRVDLILTDMVMPRMSGTELAAAVNAIRPEVPMVFMSGYSECQRIRDDAGQVLQKPFSTGTLITRIREELQRKSYAVIPDT